MAYLPYPRPFMRRMLPTLLRLPFPCAGIEKSDCLPIIAGWPAALFFMSLVPYKPDVRTQIISPLASNFGPCELSVLMARPECEQNILFQTTSRVAARMYSETTCWAHYQQLSHHSAPPFATARGTIQSAPLELLPSSALITSLTLVSLARFRYACSPGTWIHLFVMTGCNLSSVDSFIALWTPVVTIPPSADMVSYYSQP